MGTRRSTDAKRVPAFQTEAEAAAFWDTHSPLDFPDEFEEVQVRFTRPLLRRGVAFELSPEAAERLRRVARERGTTPSALAQDWILQRLEAL